MRTFGRWMQVPEFVLLYILSFCIIPKCRLWRDGWKTASKTNKKKSERKPCRATEGRVWILQSQEQIWCYRNSYFKSLCLSQSTWQSHFWAFKQTVWRTSQAASVPTNKGYTSPQSEAVWLTHMRSSDHCSFVLSWTHKLKTHTSSWPCCHFHSHLSFPWVNLSLSVSL